jgi:NAD(P)H-dependent flavin oxidoreductase YrpB (nitropropane dioxygenase family)
MTKHKKSSTKYARVLPTRPVLWISPYASPETLTHMRRTEAREWVQRYRAKAREDGAAAAQVWWAGIISAIERKRGLDAATELRRLMNEERNEIRSTGG